MINLLILLYFLSLFGFTLIAHTVYYCTLLVINSLLCSAVSYLIFGNSWYTLLFCLVYVGGIYILFIFVSVYSPNSSFSNPQNFNSLTLLLLIIFVLSIFIWNYNFVNLEFSSFLCTNFEGNFYICMCLTLLFGFLILNLIMNININYYR